MSARAGDLRGRTRVLLATVAWLVASFGASSAYAASGPVVVASVGSEAEEISNAASGGVMGVLVKIAAHVAGACAKFEVSAIDPKHPRLTFYKGGFCT